MSEGVNGAFWTLPVEVEFYLLVGCALALGIVLNARSLAILLVVALVLRIIISAALPPTREVTLPLMAHFHLPGILIEFLMGVVVWRLTSQGLAMSRRVAAFGVGILSWLALALAQQAAAASPSGGGGSRR